MDHAFLTIDVCSATRDGYDAGGAPGVSGTSVPLVVGAWSFAGVLSMLRRPGMQMRVVEQPGRWHGDGKGGN